jgi:hypothetical protein
VASDEIDLKEGREGERMIEIQKEQIDRVISR